MYARMHARTHLKPYLVLRVSASIIQLMLVIAQYLFSWTAPAMARQQADGRCWAGASRKKWSITSVKIG